MNDALDRPIRKFNPGTFQSDDEVVRQFVVRQGELDLVLEVIRGNTDSPSCQHVLIVGPRGRGKTMLLARVGAELRTDNALSERLFPVRFMEESQEIASLADFWLEALFHLARANATGNPEFSRELLATHADLTARWRDTNIEECARAAFLEAADRLDRKVVLMVENLQSLCSDVDDDFGWQLRQTLQSEPRLMLLATATSRFRGLDDANRPFFELFRIVELEPLSTDACRRLWNMVSGDKQTSREIKPLRILTGGSPRLLVIVATFARHRSLRQLMEELVTLVDDHTEYFRSHLEVLAKTERRVYLAVIDLWQSSSAHEIAARARMDIRTASALIARLVDRGAVVAEGTGRKRKYAAAERLYSIYYKLRRERDEAGLVRNLIQFMTVFYRSDELAEMVGTWRVEAAQSPPIREGLERALAASDTLDLQMEVAKALLNKGVMHHERGEHEAELAAYDDLLTRFAASDTLELQVQVAQAMFNKGVMHRKRGESRGGARSLRRSGRAFRRQRHTEAPSDGCPGAGQQGCDAWPARRVRRGAGSLRRSGRAFRRQRHTGAPGAGCQGDVQQGHHAPPARRVRGGAGRLQRSGRAFRRQQRFGTPGAGRPGAVQQGRYAQRAQRARRRRWPPSTIWSPASPPATPWGSRCRLPRRCSTRALRTTSAASPRRRWPPSTIWSPASPPATPWGSRCRLPRRCSTRALRTTSAVSPRRRSPLTTILVTRFGETHTGAPGAGCQGAVQQGLHARTTGRVRGRVDSLRRSRRAFRRQRHTGAPGAGCQGTVQQGHHPRPAWRVRGGTGNLRRSRRAFRRQRHTGTPGAGCRGAVQQGHHPRTARRIRGGAGSLRRSRRPFSAPATPWRSRCRLPRRYGTKVSPTVSAASPRRSWQPTTISSRVSAPATRRSFRCRFSKALLNKGARQIEAGRAEEALRTSDELDRRFAAVVDTEPSVVASWRWQAKWMRTHALLVLNEHRAALDVFQSVWRRVRRRQRNDAA